MKRLRFEKAALLLMAIICVLAILNIHTLNPNTNLKHKSRDTDGLDKLYNQTDWEESPTLWPSSSSCERNESASAVEGFSTLPDNIKDFLFYRHCRSFPMLLDVPNKCGGPQNSADVFLLLVIKSSPQNYERREVLRKTWAEERLYKGVWIRRLFISGTTGTGFEKIRFNKLLKHENNEHHDILQWDFKDTFFNLTLKQMLFLRWMEQRCPNVRFLLNGDDDIFAHTFNIAEYLQGLKDNDGGKHLFVGQVMEKAKTIRKRDNKYFVPKQIQQSDTYPSYCSGGGFLLSGYTARTIYRMSYNVTLISIDDAYIGMCLEKAGLKPTIHIGVIIDAVQKLKADVYNPCFYRELLLVHRFLPHQVFLMWKEIQDPHLQCKPNQPDQLLSESSASTQKL